MYENKNTVMLTFFYLLVSRLKFVNGSLYRFVEEQLQSARQETL